LSKTINFGNYDEFVLVITSSLIETMIFFIFFKYLKIKILIIKIIQRDSIFWDHGIDSRDTIINAKIVKNRAKK